LLKLINSHTEKIYELEELNNGLKNKIWWNLRKIGQDARTLPF